MTDFPKEAFCGHGCSRMGKLREVVKIPGIPDIALYRCRWHEASLRRWSKRMKRLQVNGEAPRG